MLPSKTDMKFNLRKIITDHVQDKIRRATIKEINTAIDFYLEPKEFKSIQEIMSAPIFKHRSNEILLCTILIELLCNIIYDTLKAKK